MPRNEHRGRGHVIDLSGIGRAKVIQGIPASPGIVIGPAFILDTERPHVEEETIPEDEIENEVEAFQSALDETRLEVRKLKTELEDEIGERKARIFDAHLMMLEDSMIVEGTVKRIRETRSSAALALTEAVGHIITAMKRADDEYLRDRIYDIRDLERRLLMKLLGKKPKTIRHLDHDVIVLAHQLAPTHTAAMHKERVIGFATEAGGKTSHAAIMARSLEIPAVVGLHEATGFIRQGERIIVDGTSGALVHDYDEAVLAYYEQRKREFEEFERELLKFAEYPAETKDGRRFKLRANIEIPEEVDSVISHGADGIGLYRTEYLFIARDTLPDEEEQYEAYRSVVQAMAPSEVVIRTLDVGGDKFGAGTEEGSEANPFLGWRGVRYSLSHPDLFMTQLRAALRASAHGSVRIMFPMISSVGEVKDAVQVLEAARQELRFKRVPFDEKVPVGIMIETPAAATVADTLAAEVDFFSIGSNDLIQYALAVDRGNDRVAYLYDQYHPAVLRLISQTVQAARRHRTGVGLCGEMAGDPLAVLILIGLGIDELSTSPRMLPEIKSIVRSITYSFARKVAGRALKMKSGPEVRRYLEQILLKRFPRISATEMIS
ncbi:MAG: phosphoenolpyruvate--protein phosphotransferase [Candidatus Eisenbacteria bacterium]|nr:phosphoenolpyruvate--protein phosphotransferase [Candidatus Eisenbacteria bacterium]